MQYLRNCLPNFDEISNGKFIKKIQDGGRCRLKKLSNAISQLLFHWFWWNLMPRCVLPTATSIPGLCIYRGMTPQNSSISFYSSPQNSEKSANNRLCAKPVKYSNFYDNLAKVSPILMKCCMMTRISYPEHNSCSKSQIYKNSRWWRLKTMINAISHKLFV